MNWRLALGLYFLAALLIFVTPTVVGQTCSVNAGVNFRISITATMSLFGNATGLFTTPAENNAIAFSRKVCLYSIDASLQE